MTISTSGTTYWSTNRDNLITYALRLCGTLGEGETASTAQVTEGSYFLNSLVKELQTDGMPLWALKEYGPFTYTTAKIYTIGSASSDFTAPAPLKIVQAWNRDITDSTYPRDMPIIIIPEQDYKLLGSKSSTGAPNQLWYKVPGAGVTGTNGDMQGTITVFPTPDSNSQTYKQLYFVGQRPFEDFDAATDVPDFPSYWFNAILWLLAADWCFTQGTPYAERAMINKQAQMHKEAALSFGTEEGSLQLQPRPQWGDQTWHSGSNN